MLSRNVHTHVEFGGGDERRDETVLYIAMCRQQSPASVKQGGGILETRNVRVSQDFRCKTQRLERYFTWTESCWTSCYSTKPVIQNIVTKYSTRYSLSVCLVFSSCECQKFDPDLKKFIGPPDEPFRVPSTRSFVTRSGWVTRVPNTRETAT